MLATTRELVWPNRSGAHRPRGAAAPRSSGLVGRDALVWRIRVLVTEGGKPVCLSGPAGSGSAAIAASVADALSRQTRVLALQCGRETSFMRLTEILAEGLDGKDVAGTVAIVLTEVGTVAEPGFLRALAHLAAAMPQFGWLIASAPESVAGAQAVPIPLLSEAETAAALEAAVARHAAAISKVGGIAAATLCRGLPGLADRLVAEAWAAVGRAGDDAIGLPHLRTAARALVGPEVATDAPPLLRAAARTPVDPDGTFPRSALAIALERAGEAADRGLAPERDPALVAAGRGRLRFADDAAAARLLLSEFGWTFHRG